MGFARRRRTVAAAAVFLAGAALAACSNSESARVSAPEPGRGSASIVNGVQQVRIDVGDDFRFHPSLITVRQGRVRIVLHHTASTGPPHDWQLTRFPKDEVPFVQPGGTQSATFATPAPGRYQFVCTIHVQQGQIGTLIVRPGSS